MHATSVARRISVPVGMMRAFGMIALNRTGFFEKRVPVAGPLGAVVKTTHALIGTSGVLKPLIVF